MLKIGLLNWTFISRHEGQGNGKQVWDKMFSGIKSSVPTQNFTQPLKHIEILVFLNYKKIISVFIYYHFCTYN